MFKRKRREVISLRVFERKCTGCGNCAERCPHKVLGMVYEEKRSYATVEFFNRCAGCGRCSSVCPSDAIELITR